MKRITTDKLKAELGMLPKTIKVELLWPPKRLNPNYKIKWGEKSRLTKEHKKDCFCLLMQHRHALKGKRKFKLIFRPPDNHKRDLDNCIASCKALLDAVSLVTGVDDSLFDYQPVMGAAHPPYGMVEVEFEA